MSATGSGPAGEPESDHLYFQAIEEAFVRLRGSPLLLSPSDWRIASAWHRQGVPLALVLSTLEDFFARRRERGTGRKVQSLRYCASAVEAAWEAVRELTAAGSRQPAPALDLPGRLDALARSLPEDLSGRNRLAAAIRALSGPPPEVENGLARLDGEALAAADERLTEAERTALEADAATALAGLADRLTAEETAAGRDRIRRRALRRRLGLPVLSLFAPEAEAGDRGPAAPDRGER